jgi:hypothetical protein
MFFGTMAFGAGPALIPGDLRRRGCAACWSRVYLLIANVFGQAGGPLDRRGVHGLRIRLPELVRYSLAVVPAMLLLCGAALVASGFRGLREMRR